MFSIVTAAYNIISMGFSWKENLENWWKFLDHDGEIVITVNTSKDDTKIELFKFFTELDKKRTPWSNFSWRIVETDFSYDDPEFDGKTKNVAYQAAKGPIVLALDLDEILPLRHKYAWRDAGATLLRRSDMDGLIIPSIDICKDMAHCKSIGQKFYLIKKDPAITRGVPAFARKADGSIDITKSDTTEFLRGTNLATFGNVTNSMFGESQQLSELQSGRIPFVLHLGYLNKEQRLKQAGFWKPVWENRAKSAVTDIIDTAEKFDNIKVKPHSLERFL